MGCCEHCILWILWHIRGTVGGLFGLGGGFTLGPLFLDIGVIPHVASATATFVMMYSRSLSVVEFYFHNRFPFLMRYTFIPDNSVCFGWLLGSILCEKIDLISWASIDHSVHPFRCYFRQCSDHGRSDHQQGIKI